MCKYITHSLLLFFFTLYSAVVFTDLVEARYVEKFRASHNPTTGCVLSYSKTPDGYYLWLECDTYRVKYRIPEITYLHWANGEIIPIVESWLPVDWYPI